MDVHVRRAVSDRLRERGVDVLTSMREGPRTHRQSRQSRGFSELRVVSALVMAMRHWNWSSKRVLPSLPFPEFLHDHLMLLEVDIMGGDVVDRVQIPLKSFRREFRGGDGQSF